MLSELFPPGNHRLYAAWVLYPRRSPVLYTICCMSFFPTKPPVLCCMSCFLQATAGRMLPELFSPGDHQFYVTWVVFPRRLQVLCCLSCFPQATTGFMLHELFSPDDHRFYVAWVVFPRRLEISCAWIVFPRRPSVLFYLGRFPQATTGFMLPELFSPGDHRFSLHPSTGLMVRSTRHDPLHDTALREGGTYNYKLMVQSELAKSCTDRVTYNYKLMVPSEFAESCTVSHLQLQTHGAEWVSWVVYRVTDNYKQKFCWYWRHIDVTSKFYIYVYTDTIQYNNNFLRISQTTCSCNNFFICLQLNFVFSIFM